MFTADLFGNPVYPEPEQPEPDDDLGDGVSYRDLTVLVRVGDISLLELSEALGLDEDAIIARLRADGTIDEDFRPLTPIGPDEMEAAEAAALAIFGGVRLPFPFAEAADQREDS